MITDLNYDELDTVTGAAIPLVLVVVGRTALAAATSTTGKAIFAGAAALAGAGYAAVVSSD